MWPCRRRNKQASRRQSAGLLSEGVERMQIRLPFESCKKSFVAVKAKWAIRASCRYVRFHRGGHSSSLGRCVQCPRNRLVYLSNFHSVAVAPHEWVARFEHRPQFSPSRVQALRHRRFQSQPCEMKKCKHLVCNCALRHLANSIEKMDPAPTTRLCRLLPRRYNCRSGLPG